MPANPQAGASARGLIDYVRAQGFVFEPWHIATFVAAARTKPFLILAGISGTGKTRLPQLIAEGSGASCEVVPVRPDWTDSSELLGYERLGNTFRPGPLLKVARAAGADPDRQYFFVLDEMNIARVEYYLAEVLSRIEDAIRDGGPRPLLPDAPTSDDAGWGTVGLPSNLCIVGSVNMDETTFGFSKKVLDRSFVIEFSEVDLRALPVPQAATPNAWTSAEWRRPYAMLSQHPQAGSLEVGKVIESLVQLNEILQPAQLQFGYRVRDEICLFWLQAQALAEEFVTSDEAALDPLDIVVATKILPRIQGGGRSIRLVLEGLAAWATPESGAGRGFPYVAERVRVMSQRLDESGFTSFWL